MFGTSAYGSVEYGGEQQRGLNYSSAVSDIINLTDSKLFGRIKTIIENIGITPVLSRLGEFYRSISDTLSLTDVTDGIRARVKVLLDMINLADSISRAIIALRNEVISTLDSIKKVISRAYSDSFTFTESIVTTFFFYETLSEVVKVADNFVKSTIKNISEIISVSGSMQKLKQIFRTFTENIVASEAFSRLRTAYKNFSETIVITDIFSSVARKILKAIAKIKGVSVFGSILSERLFGKMNKPGASGRIGEIEQSGKISEDNSITGKIK